jgi:hypothetical protein
MMFEVAMTLGVIHGLVLLDVLVLLALESLDCCVRSSQTLPEGRRLEFSSETWFRRALLAIAEVVLA